MARKANARRYAQAVFEMALEKKELERWQSDLQKIVGVVSDNDFLAAMESPKIKLDDKSRLLSEILGDINPMSFDNHLFFSTNCPIFSLFSFSNRYFIAANVSFTGVITKPRMIFAKP